ncbi:integrase [Catenulispora sp. MAP12-49]|uniref:tyrosine-type recombinase/integrase n=1 Tax=Catenulispora sp. MAP12-49 TaxID=3156302 RepID=UPI00351484F8
MRSGMVLGDLRVQKLTRSGGGSSYTILGPDASVVGEADDFLREYDGRGTQKTYAYHLVDHLRWRQREQLTTETITLRDLHRYMGAVGANVAMPFGQPWRTPPKCPYNASALQVTASCLKGFYLHRSGLGVNPALGVALAVRRLPTRADRDRSLLGHTLTSVSANPLAPKSGPSRRHPKMLPDGAAVELLAAVTSARDKLVVTWLSDTALRVGGLAGLHLVDLHLRPDAGCGECKSPHLHVCHRPGNPNEAAAKTKPDWRFRDGVVSGGEIVRVSPAMISSYFEYMTTEYQSFASDHGMLLIQLFGLARGEPWTTDGVRGMLRRAGKKAALPGRIKPHAFRHTFTSAVLDASGGDLLVAKTAGNWSSVKTVDEIYGHPDLHSPEFISALRQVWGEEE